MKWLWTISLLTFFGSMSGQDLLLTQFDRVAGLTNPALVGNMDSDYRVHTHYRNQWPGIGEAYVSSLLSAEGKFFEQERTGSFLGAGLVLVNDKAGNSALTQRAVRGSAAYNLKPNDYNQLAFGLQVAYLQRSINFEDLAWDSQYNGTAYDPSLSTQENFAGNKQSGVDAGAGISWEHNKKRAYRFSYGIFHMMQNRTFLDAGSDKLSFRHTLQWNLSKRYSKVAVRYMILGSKQAGAHSLAMGSVASYRFGTDSKYTTFRTSSVIMAGAYYHYGDAITPVVGGRLKEYVEVLLGYDITLSNLNRTNNYRGGWEISLRYNGSFTEQRRRLK